MARVLTTAIVLTSIVAACSGGGSDSGGGSSSGGVAGSACIDYTSCGSGLYCFVSTDALEGKCEALPSACPDKGDCSCIGDANKSKCASSGSCSARVGRAMYSCPQSTRKKEGETCSLARGCEAGLYCRVDTRTRTGTCVKFSACASDPSCECLKGEACPGQDYRECSILGDLASVVCE